MKKIELLNKLFSDTESLLIGIIYAKIDILKEKLNDLVSFHKQLFISDQGSNIIDARETILRKKLIAHIESLLAWLKSEASDVESLFQDVPWVEWQDRDIMSEKKLPEKLELPYLEDLPIQNLKKSISFRFYKGPIYKLKSSRYYKKRNLEKENNPGRIVHVPDFVHFYFTAPVSEFLLMQWQKILQASVNIMYKAYQSTETLKDEILMTNKLDSEEDYWENLRLYDPRQSLLNYQKIVTELQQDIQNFKEDVKVELHGFLDKLTEQIGAALDIAGSPLLPNRKSGGKKRQKKLSRLTQRFNKAASKWKHQYDGTKDEWLKNLELSFLQFIAADMYYDTRQIIDQKVQNKIAGLFNDIKNVLMTTNEKFQDQNRRQQENLRNLLLVENTTLVKLLRQQKLPELLDIIIQANIDKAFRGYFNRIDSVIEGLSDEHIIFTERDINHSPPNSKSTEIPLKELVQEEIIASSFKAIEELVELYESKNESISRGISNLDQIVEFNLDAAHNLLKEREDEDAVSEAKQIAVDGLERTLTNLKELETNFISAIESETQLFSEISQNFEYDIQRLGDNEKILELKLRLARAKTKENIIRIQKRVWTKTTEIFPIILKGGIDFSKKIRSELLKIRKATGLGPQVQYSGNIVTRFLIETHKKINGMPYIYKRLFSLDPLKEKRFFYARTSHIDQLKEDFANLENGFQVATAIVGEKGNGKTTILNFAEKEIFAGFSIIKADCKTTLYRESDLLDLLKSAFSMPGVKSLDEIETKLQNEAGQKICIFENVHNLFLRIIDGFEALERFLLLISNTRHKIFWIVTSGLYAWEYLDRFLRISDNFIRVIILESLSEVELIEIILRRHQVSGYGTLFQECEKISNSRQYKRLTSHEERQNYLKEAFFEELKNISGGNIKSAMLFWLSALRSFDEEKIEIASEITLDQSFVSQLPADELFSLAALIEHEYLNIEQFAVIFNQNLDETKLVIGRLYRKGFLAKINNDYMVNSYLYRPIVKTLKSKNILN